MIDSWRRHIDIGKRYVHPSREQDARLVPIEHVIRAGHAELRGDIIVGGVCDMECAVDADNTGILGPTNSLVVFGGIYDGLIEAREIIAVCRPSKTD